MSELPIAPHWQRFSPILHSAEYLNAHTVRCFDDSCKLQVDAAPDWGGGPDNTRPEQAPAAVSRFHLMTSLALAEKAERQAKKRS